MAKTRSIFVCQSCGAQNPQWQGKCSSCGEWNTLQEEVLRKSSDKTGHSNRSLLTLSSNHKPQSIGELSGEESQRIELSLEEINRVLGGGLVPGSVILLGGDPGIGKSTLILQILSAISQKGLLTLYASGEESGRQISLRAKRLNIEAKNLLVLTETRLENVLGHLQNPKPIQVLCIDSIQTLFSEELESSAGSVGQIRAVAATLVENAKQNQCITFLVGHVTKEGNLAGPRVLEHMVDTVLSFEGNQGHPYRILRTTKNRFGSTNEIGVFEMTGQGLVEVKNPSEFFLSDHTDNTPGSAITVPLEGTRPILVELQSLTLPSYGGPPRRTCMGTDANRVALLAAVIQRELNLSIADQDLYVKVVGGLKITEPAADLGLLASMTSSRLNRALPKGMVLFGEVGLTGEVRAVQQPELRIQEAAKLGFSHCILPQKNLKRVNKEIRSQKIQCKGISHIREIIPFLHNVAPKTKLPLQANA
jgi:DNA repair protein RadA/Sms